MDRQIALTIDFDPRDKHVQLLLLKIFSNKKLNVHLFDHVIYILRRICDN